MVCGTATGTETTTVDDKEAAALSFFFSSLLLFFFSFGFYAPFLGTVPLYRSVFSGAYHANGA